MKILNVKGADVVVDDERYEEFAAQRWYLNTYGYAVRSTGTSGRVNHKIIWLHREVVGNPKIINGRRAFVDHIDRNPLNNQRSNLRVCSHSQNLANRPKPARQPGYKGVYWHVGAQKWMARITVDYKAIYLGLHIDPVLAARAYDAAAKQHFGEFAWLNNV